MAFEMLLRDHGMEDKADCLKAALEKALADPQAATPDIGGTGTTSVFTDAVIAGILENKR